MAKLQIRRFNPRDIEQMVRMDHDVQTIYGYKMECQRGASSTSHAMTRMRLPRELNVPYPRDDAALAKSWSKAELILIGSLGETVMAYLCLDAQRQSPSAWVTDICVDPLARRKGVASVMLRAAEDWARRKKMQQVLLEIGIKNDPAIRMAIKNGYENCGYIEDYYANRETAVFFRKLINL